MNFLGLFLTIIYVLIVVKLITFITLSISHYIRSRLQKLTDNNNNRYTVSVIVPCFNEEKTLKNCIHSILLSTYEKIEIIVVDDGSTDKTSQIGRAFAKKHTNISFFSRKNSGKAASLNYGIKKSNGDIIVSLDADSVLDTDAITNALQPFSEKDVAAVAGNVKVANKEKLFGLVQAAEYLAGLNLQRRSLDFLNSLTIIPGALGVFRKSVLIEVGGYSYDTKVEDMDLTVAIQNAGYKVVYEPCAIVYTEAPSKLGDFVAQRKRWIYGSFRVVKKYRNLLFNKNGGRIGNIGLLYSIVFPFLDVFLSALFIISLVSFAVTGNLQSLLELIAVVSIYNILLGMYSLIIDKDHPKLAIGSIFLGIWYYHLVSFITVLSIYAFISSEEEVHTNSHRLGKNFLPA